MRWRVEVSYFPRLSLATAWLLTTSQQISEKCLLPQLYLLLRERWQNPILQYYLFPSSPLTQQYSDWKVGSNVDSNSLINTIVVQHLSKILTLQTSTEQDIKEIYCVRERNDIHDS